MLLILSPSKKLDETSAVPNVSYTQPHFLSEAEELIGIMALKNTSDLKKLMRLSDKLAALNYARYQNMQHPLTIHNARPALFTFKGDVYDKMDVAHYTQEDLFFAQKHVRILSGLYGLLKPLDLMQPYRLEMGTSLETNRGKNLYQFWGNKLTNDLNEESAPAILNLASAEYHTALQLKQLNAQVITVHFKQLKNGQMKTIGLMAKRARGMMANWVIKNRITKPTDVIHFTEGGYQYVPDLSDESAYSFVLDMEQ